MDTHTEDGKLRLHSEHPDKWAVIYMDEGFFEFEDLQEAVDFVVERLPQRRVPMFGIRHFTKRGWNHTGPDGVIPTLKRFVYDNDLKLPEDFFPHIDKAPSLP